MLFTRISAPPPLPHETAQNQNEEPRHGDISEVKVSAAAAPRGLVRSGSLRRKHKWVTVTPEPRPSNARRHAHARTPNDLWFRCSASAMDPVKVRRGKHEVADLHTNQGDAPEGGPQRPGRRSPRACLWLARFSTKLRTLAPRTGPISAKRAAAVEG